MLGHALQEHVSLTEINLKFLEPGHTYMECDAMHSTIERVSRGKEIYVPNDWKSTARAAKKKGTPYSVIMMRHYDFYDYKDIRDRVRLMLLLIHSLGCFKKKKNNFRKVT